MQRNFNKPLIHTIEKIVDETPTVRTITFTDDIFSKVLPGQFAMVWIPGINEMPMSIMISPDDGKASFTVRTHGPTYTALFNLTVGDQIGIRGPYGNSFDIKSGKLVLIGGGTGLVPLMRLIAHTKQSDEITLIMGSSTKDEVFFEEYAKKLLVGRKYRVIPVTDDGTYGEKGFATDVLEQLLNQESFDAIYTCGPEIMMYKAVSLANSKKVFIQASIERMMKCGVGICGSCCMGDSLVCRDGTIFDGKTLQNNCDFGHVRRNKSGIIENY